MSIRGNLLSRGVHVCSVLLCVFCMSFSVVAQTTTARVLGVVNDQAGAAISGAKVTARNVGTNRSWSVTTDAEGRFLVSELPLGEYEVEVEQSGFSKEVRKGVILTVGREAVVIFNLRVGAITDEMVVQGDVPLVSTTTSEISALVDSRTIRELPLNGRDLFQLATLQIGVANPVGALLEQQIDSGTGSVKMSINGGRLNYNNFLLDGTSVNEAQNTTPGGVTGAFVGVDAMQEFQLLTNNYSAEYGGAGGGIINVVSKSGTNSIHGTVFEYLRNSALDARNFFDVAEPPGFKRNQFGGSIGAPIIRDRTFIFGAYEGLRERLARTQRFVVPSNQVRNTLVTPGGAMVDPDIQPYLALYPRPNGPDLGGGQAVYIRSGSGKTRGDYFQVRGDHNFSPRNSFFVRYTFDDSDRSDPRLLIQNSFLEARNQYVTLADNHVFSPSLVNSLRFSYNRSKVFGDDVDVIRIPPELFFVPGATGLGFFRNLGGLSPLSDRTLTPRFLIMNNFELNNQMSYARGRHGIKFGFLGRRTQFNALSTNAAFGGFIFGTYEFFLTDRPQLFAAPIPPADAYRGIRTSLYALYFQDDWRVRRNLTFNLGLRYEFITSPTEANNKLTNLRNVLTDRAPTVGAPFFKNPSLKDFGPRVGFAWDVMGNGRTSLRGGYGIFYAHPVPAEYRFEMSNQPPFFVIGLSFPFTGLTSVRGAFNTIRNLGAVFGLQSIEFEPDPAYVQQWNLNIQRDLIAGITATVAYVGSRGINLSTNNSRNIAQNFTVDARGKLYPVNRNAMGQIIPNPRVNPNLGSVRQIQWSGDSYYHGFQFNLARRFSQGVQFHLAYTWSKSLDTASDSVGIFQYEAGQLAQDPYNLRGEKGRSAFDLPHLLSLNFVYELPYKKQVGATGGRRVADFFLAGWQLNGIVTAQSGSPFHPIMTFNNANDANTDLVQRPDWAPGFNPSNVILGRPEQWFNPNAFVLPPEGRYGTVGRNVLDGPDLHLFDLSLVKRTYIGEQTKVEFRFEAFNVLNHPNFTLPGADEVEIITGRTATEVAIRPPSAGKIFSTATTSRQLQFALRINF